MGPAAPTLGRHSWGKGVRVDEWVIGGVSLIPCVLYSRYIHGYPVPSVTVCGSHNIHSKRLRLSGTDGK